MRDELESFEEIEKMGLSDKVDEIKERENSRLNLKFLTWITD
jgi:hypothetical protein